jgi:site-specific DNA-methyltransferase (adenine-specific)
VITIPRSTLHIAPDRQRGNVTPEAIGALADSIERHSLLHPPVVREISPGAYALVAGETRLRAIDSIHAEARPVRCGGTVCTPGTIPVTPLSELTPLQAFEAELEENVRRTALPWQKEVEATAKLHKLKLAAGLSHREALRETASTMTALQQLKDVRSVGDIHKALLLNEHRDDPTITKAKTQSEAVRALAKKLQKQEDNAAAPVAFDLSSFRNEDCLEVLAALPDASFDAIVSDPPYGIGVQQMSWQTSEQEYDDSPEEWSRLMDGLWEELPRVLKPDSAGFLFCDWSRFAELAQRARAAGFETYPRPFIWDRAPYGRFTEPDKWPRRVYECILYFRRGLHVLQARRDDVLRYPADRAQDNYHGAKKPTALFVDLCERLVRPGEAVLDPFAGSGPLSRAAKQLNLRHLSIERDPTYYALMLRLYEEGGQNDQS